MLKIEKAASEFESTCDYLGRGDDDNEDENYNLGGLGGGGDRNPAGGDAARQLREAKQRLRMQRVTTGMVISF